MRRRCVSHRCGNLRLVTGMAPLACDLRLCGDASLHATDLPQAPLGDPRRLRPPAKPEGCSLRVSGGVKNPKTRLWGSLWVPSAMIRRLAPNKLCYIFVHACLSTFPSLSLNRGAVRERTTATLGQIHRHSSSWVGHSIVGQQQVQTFELLAAPRY
jgi:hypothetical protein